ncbi:PNPLA domain-containing protein [Paraburkholderia tropica]|uniref:patatin-like phospholipase family protein n=1 Tax=Paraburkholderia tropica TaxID=92647 RepID=UPI001CB3946F|nr:patatin-like phospholipase family protein [Paraburkholderia tropica]CAG9211601.1 PNPLA domain-containing protein [Paraburkholderia tropica]
MLDLHSLVLGGGGAKGVVYPKALQKLHRDRQIDLRAVPHVAGASAGALTGFILALGGTPEAIARLSPTITEALPFATKSFANRSETRIALSRASTVVDYAADKLDGSTIPSVLMIWAETALLQLMRRIVEQIDLDDEGDSYLALDGERYYLNELHGRGMGFFWDYDVDPGGPHIAALRTALMTGLRDLRRFGCYLVSTHHRIVTLLRDAGIDAGWKHLSVTLTRLYSAQVDSAARAETFGSLNYVSTLLPPGAGTSERNPVHKAFVRHEGVCLLAAAQASGAFPLLFAAPPLGPSPSLRDFLYTDGGCMSNMPIEAPIFADSIIGRPTAERDILALGLNDGDEASSLPSAWQMWAVQRLMLPSAHKTIVVPADDSFYASARRDICSTPPAAKTEHGALFRFSMKPEGDYRIFYASKLPDAPISLTAEIPMGTQSRGVQNAIDEYADSMARNLALLVQQAGQQRGGLVWGGL